MKISLNLVESDKVIYQQILSHITQKLSVAITNSVPKISTDIKQIIGDSIKTEPEYSSLINGQLRKEFGIDDVSKVDLAVDYFLNTLNVVNKGVKYSATNISGGLKLTFLSNVDINNIANNTNIVVNDIKGYSIPWLDWLLLRGTSIIIKNYSVKFGANPRSRSGDAIMISSKSSWSVPAAFAGSADSNWITRAISKVENNINSIIQKNIERQL